MAHWVWLVWVALVSFSLCVVYVDLDFVMLDWFSWRSGNLYWNGLGWVALDCCVRMVWDNLGTTGLI
jgi:hypothetical protein